MSQLVIPSHTYVGNIPIGRRIREILKEKGMGFTISAMSARMGINRETLRKMLTGEREWYTFELDKIANELDLSVSRLLQEDMRDVITELDAILSRSSDLHRAKDLVEKLLSVAIGVTERTDANIYAGRVFFELQQYELSHSYRIEAYSLATIIKESYGDDSRLDVAIRNMLTSFTIRNDYSNACVMMERAKNNINNDPKRLGEIYYTLAMMAFSVGRVIEARGHLIQSLESYSESNDRKEIGKALHNVAFIEYKLKNFEKAKELFEKSIDTFDGYPLDKLIAIKDYVKVLNKLGHKIEAVRLIEEGLKEPLLFEFPDLEAKLRLLHSIYTDQTKEVLLVLESKTVSETYKLIACKILMDYYKRQGKSEHLMKYYIIAEEYTLSDSDRYGEEDL